ncbi:hypothetical protein IJ707_01125 [bacterium]|nr:hypothetical protein [bacterium]
MFENLKDTITDLAYSAVTYAENKLETSTGKEKKRTAVNYVINKLALPPVLKPFIALLLSSFIDNAIEKAVKYINQVKYED